MHHLNLKTYCGLAITFIYIFCLKINEKGVQEYTFVTVDRPQCLEPVRDKVLDTWDVNRNVNINTVLFCKIFVTQMKLTSHVVVWEILLNQLFGTKDR